MGRPRGLRARLLLSVLGAMALLLASLTLVFNLVLSQRLDDDAAGLVQARAAAGLGALSVASGRIRLPEAPDERSPDTRLWVYQGDRAIELPPARAPADDLAAARLAASAPASHDVAATQTRLYALPVVQGGHRVGAVVAAVSLAPYRQTRRTALVASLLLALVVFAAVAFAAAWLTAKALRPVAVMTRQAEEWSEHDLDRRFALGSPRDELTELAATLDRLLERIAASLRREQRVTAELSHELRTPLSSITVHAQLALRHAELSEDARSALENVRECAERMARTLETLLAAARAELDPQRASSDAAAGARAALAAAAGDGRDLAVALTTAPGVRVAAERVLVERILAPLLENARRHAAARVEVSVRADDGHVLFTVADDGPGVAAEQLEAIFEPGRRGAAPAHQTDAAMAAPSSGAGLGLALARRLARSAGGEVEAHADARGGCFRARLPRA